jgi:SAM-dependent methyltransferase
MHKAHGEHATAGGDRPKYGIDAPGVIRNLLAFGALSLLLGSFLPTGLRLGPVIIDGQSFLWAAALLLASAALMLLYALHGKFGHRDRMLALHDWRGDEQVLDVGTGGGLLLVGAAQRLNSGHAFGLDIWSRAQRNLRLAGVSNRCTLVSGQAQQMNFPNGTFDVIVSNLCLHNIYDSSSRKLACAEIARVLKPNGVAIISDYRHTKEYANEFNHAGLLAERLGTYWFNTFPPLSIVVARKPPVRAGIH